MVEDLNLTDAQKSDINGILKDFRSKLIDSRDAMVKADAEVQTAFDENPVDQRKAMDAIDRLAAARGDMTRSLSQMSLKIRGVLTAEQWQELQRRRAGGRGRGGFPGGPGGGGARPRFTPAPSSTTKQ
jgi:Spy/CpxP family protein refolding chaperone